MRRVRECRQKEISRRSRYLRVLLRERSARGNRGRAGHESTDRAGETPRETEDGGGAVRGHSRRPSRCDIREDRELSTHRGSRQGARIRLEARREEAVMDGIRKIRA